MGTGQGATVNYWNWIRTLPIWLVILLSGCGRESDARARELAAASALFGRFETVYYARTRLFWEVPNGLSRVTTDFLVDPFWHLQKVLRALGSAVPADVLGRGEAVLVGAKDFRSPNGLGPVYSRRCYVIVLGNRSTVDLRKHLPVNAVTSAESLPIWSWKAKLGEFGENDRRDSSIYAAQIGRSYVVVSNDLDELRTVIARLASPGKDSEVSSGSHDWDHVTRSEVWGYRRYRHADVVNRDAAGMAGVAVGTEALVFYLDASRKSAVLRLPASAGSAATAAYLNTRNSYYMLRWRQADGETWEAPIALVGNEKATDQLFLVLGLFGFATYL
jgi:hypothetical protein